jgi:hypothetical protein
MPTSTRQWQPIAGVDLATYTQLSAALLKRGLTGRDADAFATAAGISPGNWTQARAGWTARIHEHDDVRSAYARLYRSATVGTD